jgi:site-specific recombinase XerD
MAFKTRKKGIKGKTEMTSEVMSIIEKYSNGFTYAKVEKEKFSADLTNTLKVIAKKANLSRIVDYTDNKKQTHSDPLHKIIASHFGRHTFCTRKVREGVPLETLKLLTAHSNTQTLQKYYVHLTEQDEVDAIKKDKEKRSGVIKQSDEDKVQEYKDVLAFYQEPYINYKYIMKY